MKIVTQFDSIRFTIEFVCAFVKYDYRIYYRIKVAIFNFIHFLFFLLYLFLLYKNENFKYNVLQKYFKNANFFLVERGF